MSDMIGTVRRVLRMFRILLLGAAVCGQVALCEAAADNPGDYFPLPESQGGWRKIEAPDDIRRLAAMDPDKLATLREWLLQSDDRAFAAVVIRRGYVVLEVERGKSGKEDTGNIKSCAKAICATVLAIASQETLKGQTPRRMAFDDPAFDFIPWAQPLSDARKARITVKQLLNHTSGITPESTGARNAGPWQWIVGHADDARTASLKFDPGADLDYTTHAFYHAALVCEVVTGMPYDRFAAEKFFKPLGIEKSWFEYLDGDEKHSRHPSHAVGLPAREMARIAYCMLRGGRWGERQIIPKWFIVETAAPTHAVTGIKTFERDAQSFSHGWELPGRISDGRGKGIPPDARFKPGSGGQLIAFVPSLDLAITRQTGSSGQWQYEEYLRRACEAVVPSAQADAAGEPKMYFPSRGESLENQNRRKPEEVGLKPDLIAQLQAKTSGGGRWALWRHGYLIHIQGDFHRKTDVASLRKTWHALTVGAAIKQGKIPSYFQKISVWNKDLAGKHAEATWWHVITQTSGFDYPYGEFPAFGPGEIWTYSDRNPINLCNALARVYGKKDYRDTYGDVARAAYFDAIGMEGWSTALKRDSSSGMEDGVRFVFSLENLGRLGLLVLARGKWNGAELVPQWFVEELETKQAYGSRVNYNGPCDGQIGLDPKEFPEAPYGFMAWVNTDGDYFPGADRAWAWGAGAGGCYVLWNRNNGVVFVGIGLALRPGADGIPHAIESGIAGPNPLSGGKKR